MGFSTTFLWGSSTFLRDFDGVGLEENHSSRIFWCCAEVRCSDLSLQELAARNAVGLDPETLYTVGILVQPRHLLTAQQEGMKLKTEGHKIHGWSYHQAQQVRFV